jgi:hydrogenase expression/formation protein HypC
MCLGVPGKIVSITDRTRRLGVVDVGGVRRETNLACVAVPGEELDTLVGAWVLVHVGFAMSRIDPEEAERTLELLRELGEAQATIEAMRQTAKAAP